MPELVVRDPGGVDERGKRRQKPLWKVVIRLLWAKRPSRKISVVESTTTLAKVRLLSCLPALKEQQTNRGFSVDLAVVW